MIHILWTHKYRINLDFRENRRFIHKRFITALDLAATCILLHMRTAKSCQRELFNDKMDWLNYRETKTYIYNEGCNHITRPCADVKIMDASFKHRLACHHITRRFCNDSTPPNGGRKQGWP